MARQIAIGDIHGSVEALETLISSMNLQPDDQLIFLGDYVDKGGIWCIHIIHQTKPNIHGARPVFKRA